MKYDTKNKMKLSHIAKSLLLTTLLSTPSLATTETELYQEAPPLIKKIVQHDIEGRIAVLGFNITVSCLKGGITALLRQESFWKNCSKASIGGIITFTGEEIATHNKYPFVGLAGKLIHDTGISISDNIMRGEEYFSQYQTDFGPINFTFRGSYTPTITYTLTPLYAITRNIIQHHSFDLKNSLYNLTPIFQTNDAPKMLQTSPGETMASTIGNVTQYNPTITTEDTPLYLSHENNHALFWSKLRFTNNIGNKLEFLGEIGKHWDYQQDLSKAIFNLPGIFMNDTNRAILSIPELEAYSMQRP